MKETNFYLVFSSSSVLKKASLALRIESRLKNIFSMWIN